MLKLRVSNLCNNNCIVCSSLDCKSEKQKNLFEIKNELLAAKKKNIKKILFPCNFDISPYFKEILKYVKKLGFEVTLETNARIFYYKKLCSILTEYVDTVNICFFSNRPDIHGEITKTKDSFEQVLTGIKNIQNSNIDFSVKIIIAPFNYKDIEEMVKFLVKNKVKKALVNFVFSENYPLKIPDFNKEINNLTKYKNKINICIENIPYCFLNEYEFAVNDFSDKKVKLLNCTSCKLNENCGGVWKDYIIRYDASEISPIKDLPEEVKIELTSKCNLKCNFCFSRKTEEELTTKEIFRIIDDIKNSGTKAVRFTGGEVFLRNDLKDIVKYAKSKNLYVILNTNGTLVNKKNIGIFNYVDDVLVSVNYKEDFAQKEKLFKELRKFNLILRAGTILTKQNIEQIGAYYEFFKKQNLDDVFFLRPVPNQLNKKPINHNDVKKLVEKIILFNKNHNIDIRIANSVPFCSYNPDKISEVCVGGENDSGYTRLVIDSEGNYRTDYFSDFILGNFKEKSIIDIWNSDLMKKIRSLKEVPNQCKECNYLKSCRGGLLFAKSKNKKDYLIKKETRILLLNPEFHNYNIVIEPLSLEYIASMLLQNGFKVRIFDFNIKSNNIERLFRLINKFKPKLIGFSAFTIQVENAYKIGKIIKEKFKQIKLVYGGMHQPFVYGGMHTTDFPKEPFEKGSADFVIIGEGEKPFLELAESLEKKKNLMDVNIKGLYFKEKKKIISNNKKNHISNPDLIPFPARELVNIKDYQNDIHILPYGNEKAVSIITSRGCEGDCNYCTSPQFYSKVLRFRSPENVIEEINEVYYRYNIKNIHFHDDNFMMKPSNVKKLCELIIKNKLKIKWVCLASANSLIKNKKLIPLMSKAGCIGVEIGLETSDPEILKRMNKKQKPAEILSLNGLLRKNKIIPMYLMISFYPGDNISVTYNTAQLMKKLSQQSNWLINYMKTVHLPYALGQFATPYPGTKFFDEVKREGILLSKSWNDYNRQEVNFIPNSFLEDVPTSVGNLSKAEFVNKVKIYRDLLEIYVTNPNLTGNTNPNQYMDYLYGLYKKSDGSNKIKQTLNKKNIIKACIGFKFLAAFGLIKSSISKL